MKFRKVMCFATAVLISACTFITSSADEDSSRVLEEYQADQTMLTTENDKPTMSFDMTDWSNFTHLTADASLANLEAKQEKNYAYQGGSLRISGSLDSDIENKVCTSAYLIRNDDGTLAYPECEDENAEFITMGVQLNASEFGMNYFDGCMVTFEYRINQEVQGKLVGDSVFILPYDDEYGRTGNSLQLKINDSDANNVTQYAKGVMTVPEGSGTTSLIVEVPLVKACEKTDIFYMDNLTVVTPLQSNGVDLRVANLDQYNENAKAQEVVQGLEVKAKENTLSSDASSEASTSMNTSSIFMIIGGAVLAVAIVVFILFMIKKHKNKFY